MYRLPQCKALRDVVRGVRGVVAGRATIWHGVRGYGAWQCAGAVRGERGAWTVRSRLDGAECGSKL